MNKPIEAGCLAEVIDGLLGGHKPESWTNRARH